ncbi:MAG: beta-fructosidase [Alphaproteobacteria bacterium]
MENFSKDFFTWDFWYHFDSNAKKFKVFFLNAPISLKQNEQHHFSSKIGYAETADFENFGNINYNVFEAEPSSWDNSSIWSGDVIASNDKLLFFYTSRDKNLDDGMTQNIGLAVSDNGGLSWERRGLKLEPCEDYFLTKALPTEKTTHSWRDPFLFNSDGKAMMLVSAKSKEGVDNYRGAIALLMASKGRLDNFETAVPFLDPGLFGEMEVPQIFVDENGAGLVAFSCLKEHDHFLEKGGFYAIRLPRNNFSKPSKPELILSQDSGIYAARVIPELGGEIIGFDFKNGGIKKSGQKVLWQHPKRNFDGFSF